MVHFPRQIEIAGDTVVFVKNTPFEQVPIRLLKVFDEFTTEQFVNSVSFMNKAYWNIMAFISGRAVAVSWGTFCPLEGLMTVYRIGIEDGYRTVEFLHGISDIVCEFGESISAKRVIFLSDKAKAWLRLLKPKAEVSDAQVLERVL